MKKFLMTVVATALVAVSANAQVYVGGNFGVASSKVKGGESVTTYAVLPEIGYNLNKDWALGTTVGFGKGTPVELSHRGSLCPLHFRSLQVRQRVYGRWFRLHTLQPRRRPPLYFC